MKQFYTFLAVVLVTFSTFAQVGINTENPDASAALDITSTTGGLLIPRMTEAQRDAVSSPSLGLMIYQTDGTAGFYYYNGSIWAEVGDTGPVGEVGNLYFARVEYNSTESLSGVEFLDPSENGDFLTAGANVGTIAGDTVDLTFTNEATPPKEIIAYAYQANNSRYVITQLDGGGNNASFYVLDVNETNHISSFGVGNQVTTDIMTNFGSAKLSLDLSMSYIDAVRAAGGFGQQTKETHAFVMFRF